MQSTKSISNESGNGAANIPVEPQSPMVPMTGQAYREKHNMVLKNIQSPPEPFFIFEQKAFPQFILDTIKANGFRTFTPIQAQGLPIIMSGRDFIGISKTGSGKTLAFLIPAIVHLLEKGGDSRTTSILVMSPTRELAMQIENEFKKFLSKSKVTWACVYGGIKKDYQRGSVSRGVQILVATPGRLIDFIQQGSISVEQVTYFVLDEADRMLDMGFAPQIRQIMNSMRNRKQSLMFSATWPFEIKQLADKYLNNPVSLQIGALERTINDSIKQQVKVVASRDKFKELLKDLKTTSERRLIFVQRKIDCERICENLQTEGERCVSIHGDKVQIHRDKALAQFRTGKIKILVATDVASRGLDIPDVQLVINYDFPKQIEDYIHRIGRTGRAGKSGITTSYLMEGQDNRLGDDLIKVLRESSQVVPNELLAFSKRKGGDSKYDKFNKNRYNYDINSLSSLDNWRSKDTKQTKGPEFKSMKSFEDPSRMSQQETFRQVQHKGSYKSERSLPQKSTHNFTKQKLYHPSVTFECNDVIICIKMVDIYKATAEAIVVPCLTNDCEHKLTQRMSKFLGTNIHDVMIQLTQQAKTAKLGVLKEIESRKVKTIETIITFLTEENDSDCSFLSYIVQKIIKHSLDKGYESICLHELGMGRNPVDLEARTLIYTLFEVLQNEKVNDLNEINIIVESQKEFTGYVRLYDGMVTEAVQSNNLIINNDS